VEGVRLDGRVGGVLGVEGCRWARRYAEGARVAITACGRVRVCGGGAVVVVVFVVDGMVVVV